MVEDNWNLIVEYMELGPESSITEEQFQKLLSDELNEEN